MNSHLDDGPRATAQPVRAGGSVLRRRAQKALAALAACRLCPRRCGVNRLAGETGWCGVGRLALVASAYPHHGEEDCLRGSRGSGTIFFAGCNLKCVFCQNYDISWEHRGEAVSAPELADVMLALQARGCHNVNLVTPSHVVAQILEALVIAFANGLEIPIVYNTGAYDCVTTLRLLAGAVDIYMPDFKFWQRAVADRYCRAPNYPQVARRALKEMHRQVGALEIGPDGLAVRGVLLRHLVLPEDLASTSEVMRFVAAELSPHTYVNLMDQYYPAGRVGWGGRYAELARRPSAREIDAAYIAAAEAGIQRFDQRRRWR